MFLTLTGCAKIDFANRIALVNQARSLAAEWVLVESQAERGHLTQDYARELQSSVRDQLTTISRTFDDPHSAEAAEVRNILDLPDDAPVATVRTHRDRLDQIANSLEAA